MQQLHAKSEFHCFIHCRGSTSVQQFPCEKSISVWKNNRSSWDQSHSKWVHSTICHCLIIVWDLHLETCVPLGATSKQMESVLWDPWNIPFELLENFKGHAHNVFHVLVHWQKFFGALTRDIDGHDDLHCTQNCCSKKIWHSFVTNELFIVSIWFHPRQPTSCALRVRKQVTWKLKTSSLMSLGHCFNMV